MDTQILFGDWVVSLAPLKHLHENLSECWVYALLAHIESQWLDDRSFEHLVPQVHLASQRPEGLIFRRGCFEYVFRHPNRSV